MLVEVLDNANGPVLFEVREAYADKTFFSGRDKGRTILDSSTYLYTKSYKIDLPYAHFRWAYTRSIAKQEAFLDVKPESLEKIARDYSAAERSPLVTKDIHPCRPS